MSAAAPDTAQNVAPGMEQDAAASGAAPAAPGPESSGPATAPESLTGGASAVTGAAPGDSAGIRVFTTPALEAQRQAAANSAETSVPSSGPIPASSFTWGGYFQALGILVVLLVALWFVPRVLRRLGKGHLLPSGLPRQALRLEGHLPLGKHGGVFVVRFLNKRLVLGVTDQHVALLTETEVRDDEANSPSFQQVVDEAHRRETRPEARPDVARPPRQPVDGAGPAGSGPGGVAG